MRPVAGRHATDRLGVDLSFAAVAPRFRTDEKIFQREPALAPLERHPAIDAGDLLLIGERRRVHPNDFVAGTAIGTVKARFRRLRHCLML